MLEFYFKYRGVLRRMRRGPLAGDIDDLAAELARVGYTRATARRYLSLVAKFSRYAERRGLARSTILDGALLERFLGRVSRSARTRSVARSALGHALRGVARTGLGSTASSAVADDPDARLLAALDAYLRNVRGLQPRSVAGVVLYARRLLQWYRAARPGKELSDLELAPRYWRITRARLDRSELDCELVGWVKGHSDANPY